MLYLNINNLLIITKKFSNIIEPGVQKVSGILLKNCVFQNFILIRSEF